MNIRRSITGVFLLAVGFLLPSAAHAQAGPGPLPITPEMIDFVTTITKSIDELVESYTDIFVADARTILNVIAVFMLLRMAIRWMFRPYSMWHAHVDIGELIAFLGKFAICLVLLHYYNNPLPGASFSFHQVFTNTARQISGTIDLTILGDFAKKVNEIATNLEKASPLNIFDVLLYYLVLINMAIIQAILFGVTVLGFIATGIGSPLGPFFIPLLLVPSLTGKFWRWIDFMIVYAFYRVIASAFIFIWVRVIVGFIDHAIHGDYSLAHFGVLFVPWLVLQGAFMWAILKVPTIAHELLGGGSGFGASIGNALEGTARGALRRIGR